MKLQIKATVSTDGIGQPMLDFDKVEYRKAISELPHGSTVLITISDQRTLDQNSLLHLYCTAIADYTGHSLKETKFQMKEEFLGYETIVINGIEKQTLRSTTDLTKKEFADFITQIQAWAWENLGLNLNNIPE